MTLLSEKMALLSEKYKKVSLLSEKYKYDITVREIQK